jgi:hypothetical protein
MWPDHCGNGHYDGSTAPANRGFVSDAHAALLPRSRYKTAPSGEKAIDDLIGSTRNDECWPVLPEYNLYDQHTNARGCVST